MSKQLTTEEFIEKANQVHNFKYDYSKVNYVKSKSKVVINCKIHGEFNQIPYDHLQGHGCIDCGFDSNMMSNQEFIEKANQVHNFKYDYSKVNYVNSKSKVVIHCKIHGEFEQRPNLHLQGHGCRDCGFDSKTMSNQEFIEKANQVHNFKYDYSNVNYLGTLSKINIICKIHGEFEQLPIQHLKGPGCPFCSYDSRKLSLEEFVRKSNESHKFKYDYSKVQYINSKSKVTIICPIHGEFKQTPSGHMSGDGCSECSNSKKPTTQEFIEKANKAHNFKYDYSKTRYIDCYSKIIIICKLHGEFKQIPMDHLNKICGCPKCGSEISTSFLNLNFTSLSASEGFLYLIKLKNQDEEFVKVGVTTRSIEIRTKKIAQYYDIEILKYLKSDLKTISNHEQKIHTHFKDLNYTPKIKFTGHTECFTLELLKYL